MFWFLRRTLIALVCCFLAGVALYLYTKRELFQPAIDYVELWLRQDRQAPESLPRLAGEVVNIYSGASFRLKDRYGLYYVYGLAGVTPPATNTAARPLELRHASASWKHLRDLLLGEDVEIRVTRGDPYNRTGLGVVTVGVTNANFEVLRAGWGALDRNEIRALPVNEQYELVRAEQDAQRSDKGIWQPAADAEASTLSE
jgi:endonuclease YncB( thermonuclease family)